MKSYVKMGLLASVMVSSLYADTVKAGVVMALSGPLAGYGQAGYRGLEIMKEIMPTNKRGDSLELIVMDNKSEKIESANAIRKLLSTDKVSLVFGAMTTTNTLAMIRSIENAKVPLVAAVATGDRVTKGKSFVTRIAFADSFQGTASANFAAKKLDAKTAAILFDSSSDYSIGLTKAFEDEFKKLGGDVIIKAEFKAGSKDFKAQLSNIKAKKPDMLFMPIYYNEAALVMLQAKQLDLDMPVVGGDGLVGNSVFFDVAKEAGNGVMVVDYYSTNSKQTPLGEKFIAAYKAKYNENVSSFSIMYADAYVLAMNAIAQCPKSDTACINDKVRNQENFEGVSGVFTLKNGEAIRSAVFNEVQNGQLIYKTTVDMLN